MITNEKEYNKYKNWFINKWKPIINKEREKSNDSYKAIRKNFTEFYNDFSPIYEYGLQCYLTNRIDSLVNIKDIKNFLKPTKENENG
jgi:hypothetical protein